jgi:hypothetical protein
MMDLAVYLAVGLAPTGQYACAGMIRAIEALMPDDLSNPGDFDRFPAQDRRVTRCHKCGSWSD